MFYDLNYIGATLKQARKNARLTQEDVAMRSGISRATINALENLKARDVNVNTLSQIFDVVAGTQNGSGAVSDRPQSQPQFDFPYVWSSAHPSDDLLITKVLERSIFKDVLQLCEHYGVIRVTRVFYASGLKGEPLLVQTITRMLANIQKGFALA